MGVPFSPLCLRGWCQSSAWYGWMDGYREFDGVGGWDRRSCCHPFNPSTQHTPHKTIKFNHQPTPTDSHHRTTTRRVGPRVGRPREQQGAAAPQAPPAGTRPGGTVRMFLCFCGVVCRVVFCFGGGVCLWWCVCVMFGVGVCRGGFEHLDNPFLAFHHQSPPTHLRHNPIPSQNSFAKIETAMQGMEAKIQAHKDVSSLGSVSGYTEWMIIAWVG